jgi:fructosamine-3-kinase
MELSKIINHLFPNKNLEVSRIRTGKFNESYFVKYNNIEYVLRIAPSPSTPLLFYEKEMMKKEPGIHLLILEKTDVPVAKIIEHDFSGSIIQNNWLLMERLEGNALSEITLWGQSLDKLFYKLGKSIKDVHNIKNTWFGYPEDPDSDTNEKTWYNAFFKMWSRLLNDIRDTNLYTDNDVKWLKNLLENKKKFFNHNPEPTLLHMDIWAQNILTNMNGDLTGIVDWDRGLWGDPEIEFSVIEYCGINKPAFWEGYGKTLEITKEYEIRRLFYFLYEHQKYIYIRSMRGKSWETAKKYVYDSLNIAKKLEKI